MKKFEASVKLGGLMKNEAKGEGNKDETNSSEEPLVPLVDGLDYYLENGLMVFTAYFLKRRGYCCNSGCRHCPYEKGQNRPR